jgi:hypothetical protein
VTNLRTLGLDAVLRDPALVGRLVATGAPLLVERAEPAAAAAAIASLANTLGGWMLLGVGADGEIAGIPPYDLDLDELLQRQVGPPPPARAATVDVDGRTVGVVRVAASRDTPHVAADGNVLVRDHEGRRAPDPATLRALVERGERGALEARERQHGTALVEEAMRTPERIPGDAPILDPDSFGHDAPLEFLVRATPLTVTPELTARALTAGAADLAAAQAIPLLVDPDAVAHRVATTVDGRSRGLYCTAERGEAPIFADLAIDAGGVVAARLAERRQRDGTVTPAALVDEVLLPLLRAVAGTLAGLGASGRALVDLEIRGAADLVVAWTPELTDVLRVEELLDEDRLLFEGGLDLPAGSRRLDDLAARWTRGLARAAGLPAWEPA